MSLDDACHRLVQPRWRAYRAVFEHHVARVSEPMICECCGHEQLTEAPQNEPYLVDYPHEPNDCITNLRADLAQSRKMELDAETRACAAEERAARAEAVCTLWRAFVEALQADEKPREMPAAFEQLEHDDAGASLLTAVRRLMEIVSELVTVTRVYLDSSRIPDKGRDADRYLAYGVVRSTLNACKDVLADPALAGLRGAP